ncbi:dihydroxyacetone kinase family protein, partial [Sphingomonas bacterium]|uniref:dihydroxyacetone kinase family protein n=1 Tax=Sphingomonas bacterium TaxID=1895847 RepID=UPI0015755200
MRKTKKLINDPDRIVSEMVEGMVAAHPAILRSVGDTGRVLVARDGPRDGKVGILIGGGSGHEPAFAGYVGRGLADAAVIGNVFASPSPRPIAEGTRAISGGRGVVHLYGNYSGDVMNFGMAAELCAADGIEVRSVPVIDDVASAPAERAGERRGIAGDFFVFKIAGAAADRMLDLDAVEAAARKANRRTFTMGVALEPCSLPQTRKPNFQIADGEMEIGMGIHGEPGVRTGPLESADRVTDDLMARIFAEAGLTAGDRVAVLVNGLGATAMMELYILFRRAAQLLGEREVAIHASWVGEYVTALEMAGASITLLVLDDELASLLDHPCATPALNVGQVTAEPVGSGPRAEAEPGETAAPWADDEVVDDDAPDGDFRAETMRAAVIAIRDAILDQQDWLSELDGVVGDGDHGVTMATGWQAAADAVARTAPDTGIAGICRSVAEAFLDAVGASSGPLIATAILRAGETANGRRGLDGAATA